MVGAVRELITVRSLASDSNVLRPEGFEAFDIRVSTNADSSSRLKLSVKCFHVFV